MLSLNNQRANIIPSNLVVLVMTSIAQRKRLGSPASTVNLLFPIAFRNVFNICGVHDFRRFLVNVQIYFGTWTKFIIGTISFIKIVGRQGYQRYDWRHLEPFWERQFEYPCERFRHRQISQVIWQRLFDKMR